MSCPPHTDRSEGAGSSSAPTPQHNVIHPTARPTVSRAVLTAAQGQLNFSNSQLCSPELHSAPLLSIVLLGLAHLHFLLMFSLLVCLHLFLPPAKPPPTPPNPPRGQSTFSMALDTPSPIASWWDFVPFLCSFLWLLLVQVLAHRCTL